MKIKDYQMLNEGIYKLLRERHTNKEFLTELDKIGGDNNDVQPLLPNITPTKSKWK